MVAHILLLDLKPQIPVSTRYSNPTLSRLLLHLHISILREFSSAASLRDYLRSTHTRQMPNSHLFKISKLFPAGTWRHNDVISTSMRRHDVMCLLGLVNKLTPLQNPYRNVFYTYLLPPSHKMSPQFLKHPLFSFPSSYDLSSGRQRSRAITMSRHLLI